jgi:hypothetical protein
MGGNLPETCPALINFLIQTILRQRLIVSKKILHITAFMTVILIHSNKNNSLRDIKWSYLSSLKSETPITFQYKNKVKTEKFGETTIQVVKLGIKEALHVYYKCSVERQLGLCYSFIRIH